MNYLFFNIYCWYNRMKSNGRNVDPLKMTAFLLGMSFGGWLMVFTYSYFNFIIKTGTPKILAVIIGMAMMIVSGIINEYYVANNRYLTIYNRYSSAKKRIGLSILVILIPFILFTIIGIIDIKFFHK